MDTNETKLRQGASADFSQQKPHTEVVETKTSSASSNEERLGVGISTIGLQTKRLSGAQGEKLIRERKMKGNWMVEKPPRKTPPLQVKGRAGSSGGVKRHHSDSSTPSQKKQQLKKPKNTQEQTGTYKEVVTRIKMAIIQRCHPEVTLDQTQTDIIQEKLLTAVDANPAGETPPQFLHSKFTHGVIWITCANESTKDWLMQTISGLEELWEGVGADCG
jgi:hypothetical protein